jgi:hypothetical protein
MLKYIHHIVLLVGLVLGLSTSMPAYANNTQIEFLGQAALRTSLVYRKTQVGGISGIAYDPKDRVYYGISDDRSQKAPARFYVFKIDLTAGKLKPGGVRVANVMPLIDLNKQPFAANTIDAEGIALTQGRTLWISSEGDADRLIAPFVRSFALNSEPLRALPIPSYYLPTADKHTGIRNNQALESLTITSDSRYLFTATESALYQDGLPASVSSGSPCRILRYDLTTQQIDGEFLYFTEPIAVSGKRITGPAMNGLVELLAIDNQGTLLSLERMFVPNLGFTVRLFEISLQTADNLQSIKNPTVLDLKTIKPVQKTLLLDLRTIGVPIDNLEGMSWGPKLPDGRQSLILVSDNNFSPLQVTQFLVLGVGQAAEK